MFMSIVFTGCADGVMRAYDAKTGHLLRYYTEHEGGINAITIANDKIYSGSSDSTLRVWDARDIR